MIGIGIVEKLHKYPISNFVLKHNIHHTPPEGRVRAEKILITFDTIFWGYLPRGT